MPDSPEQFPGPGENTYPADAESSAEMARLMRQERLVTSGMKGIFPEDIDLNGVQRVLDLACGPGGWALEAAYKYSDMEIVGVDISERMIAYANAQAKVQRRSNAHFQVMNILQPLDFSASSFDLVNARFISSFMKREQWPVFFKECLRVLRPGGIVRLTEIEPGFSNKPHLEQTLHRINLMVNRAGVNFSPNGYYYGILHMLPSLFRQAGLSVLGNMAHLLEYSSHTPAHESFHHDLAMTFSVLESAMEKTKVATLQEWRDLYTRGLAEMLDDDFCAAWMILTVWGQKPG
ncbi:MAG TPA: class I SAM-dependent methyltransferase [Ktedonobacteraceae bacterium]|nr:class I SAM-dependent methyltransferase [Ktedonobacteraceae bacterium]